MTSLSVVSLGSLKTDVLTQLGRDAVPVPDTYAVAPIDLRVGGTAGTFCAAAYDQFASISVIAAVGDDNLTPLLTKRLADLGVIPHLQHCPGITNGMVLSVRSGPLGEQRLLIASEASAHLHLSARHVVHCREVIAGSDALICDGYLLRAQQSATALGAAMRIANRAKVPIIFDLVPHSLPSSTSLPLVLPYIRAAQVVVAEARTIVGLYERRWPVTELPDEQLAAKAARYARMNNSEHRGATWLIRYGAQNISTVLRVAPDGTETTYAAGHTAEVDRWGFGDRLLVRELLTELS